MLAASKNDPWYLRFLFKIFGSNKEDISNVASEPSAQEVDLSRSHLPVSPQAKYARTTVPRERINEYVNKLEKQAYKKPVKAQNVIYYGNIAPQPPTVRNPHCEVFDLTAGISYGHVPSIKKFASDLQKIVKKRGGNFRSTFLQIFHHYKKKYTDATAFECLKNSEECSQAAIISALQEFLITEADLLKGGVPNDPDILSKLNLR